MARIRPIARIVKARYHLWELVESGVIDLDVCNLVSAELYGEVLFRPVPVRLPWEGERRERGTEECVYLVQDGALAKIGFTSNLTARFDMLRSGSGRRISLARAVYSRQARVLEHVLHGLFASRHVRGEWFKVSPVEWDAMLPKAFAVLP